MSILNFKIFYVFRCWIKNLKFPLLQDSRIICIDFVLPAIIFMNFKCYCPIIASNSDVYCFFDSKSLDTFFMFAKTSFIYDPNPDKSLAIVFLIDSFRLANRSLAFYPEIKLYTALVIDEPLLIVERFLPNEKGDSSMSLISYLRKGDCIYILKLT